jgi:ppGpp synthetase/RelA/SpoT-type nucleotidyltranferase
MELDAIKTEYQRLTPKYDRLKGEVSYILQQELDARHIPVHLIEGRTKTVESLVDKANGLNLEEPFDGITDICGVRVICLFRSDLSKIGEAIAGAFEIETKDDKITGSPVQEFGYLSVHYVGKLPQHYRGARYDDIKDLRFELQVRTMAMHAWDAISHHIDYKSAVAVPTELRKDFYALSALFYLADSQFETLLRA